MFLVIKTSHFLSDKQDENFHFTSVDQIILEK